MWKFSRWRKNWIYVEIVHYIKIVPLARNSPVGTLELFHFGNNWDLHINSTLRRNYPAGTSELISFWRQIGSPLGMKIPGYSLSRVPLCFRWRLGINSFCNQLESSLEFSRWHLGIKSVWRQLGSPLEFAIHWESVSGIPRCFPPLGFTLLIHSWGTTFPPLGVYYSSPFLGNYINHQMTDCLLYPRPSHRLRKYIILKY